jgi:hypothetical protein
MSNWAYQPLLGGTAAATAAGGTVYTKSLSDAMVVSDGFFDERQRNRHFEDGVTPGDALFLSRLRQKTLQYDSISMYDSGVQTIYEVRMTDSSVALGDQQWLGRERGRVMQSSISLNDQQWLGRERGRVMGDALTPNDLLALTRYRNRHMDDSAQLSDAFHHSRERGRVMFDSLTPSDGVIVTRYINKHVDDFLTILDTFTKEIASGGGGPVIHTITLSDFVSIADEVLAYRTRNRHFVDDVTLADGTVVTRERLKYLSETLTITDAQLQFLLRNIVTSDAISLTDDSLLFRFRFRALLDALNVTDDFSYTITGALEPMTLEVRARIGVQRDSAVTGIDSRATLGRSTFPALSLHAPVALGRDPGPNIGGYS